VKTFTVATTAWITKGRRITYYSVEADYMGVVTEENSSNGVLSFYDEEDKLVAAFSDWDTAWEGQSARILGKEEEPDVEGTGSDLKDIKEAEAELDSMP
jgi:hypothetical protein